MAMTAADVATVTPELETACRKLMEGVETGGPYSSRHATGSACGFRQPRRTTGAARHSIELGILRQHERDGAALGIMIGSGTPPIGAGHGLATVDPNGPYEGVPAVVASASSSGPQ
jgi:hypothetical protein